MRAFLEFDLPEEETELKRHTYCQEIWSTIFLLDERIRGMLKHGHKFKNAEEAFEKVRDMIREILEDKDVPLGLLW